MAVTGDLGGTPVTLNNAAEENTLQDIKSLLGQTTKAANINANNINTANIAAGKAAGGLSSVANSSGYASKSLDNVSNSVRQWSKDARENIAMATTAFGRSVTSTGASLSSRLSMMGEGAQKLLEGLPGLLGTVTGMIVTFQMITLYGTGDPKLMAGGISQALVTTVLGLLVAIPTTLLHSFTASSARGIISTLEEQSTGILAEHSEAK